MYGFSNKRSGSSYQGSGCHCSSYYGAAVVKHLSVANYAADIMVAAVMAAVTKAAATIAI